MSLNGVDISAYQPNDILNKIPCDFAIIKATEGDYWVSPRCDAQYQSAVASGKLVGVYHFSNADQNPGHEGACREAKWFLDNIKGYLNGRTLLVLDHEMSSARAGGAPWAKWFLDEVVRLSGYKPMLYGSRGVICNDSYSIVSDYPLWVAAYGANERTGYDQNRDPGSISPWSVVTCFQYTSHGVLPGYDDWLDLNVFYGDVNTWSLLAAKVNGSSPNPEPRKTVSQLANEVIAGLWGNGDTRRSNLVNAGYDYDSVQTEVNRILGVTPEPRKTVETLANEVIHGDWGTGDTRRNLLTAAGYDYDAVQAEVNKILGQNSRKSVHEVAIEVIRGEWGNGSDRISRIRNAGYDFDEVQAEVNKILGTSGKSNSTIANEVIRGEWGNGQDRKNRLTQAGYDYNAIMQIVNQRI